MHWRYCATILGWILVDWRYELLCDQQRVPTNPFENVNLIGGAISDGIVGQTASSTASVGGADASGGGISTGVEGVSAASAASVNGSSDAGTASVTDSAGGPGAGVVSTASTDSASTDSAPQGANIAINTETDTENGFGNGFNGRSWCWVPFYCVHRLGPSRDKNYNRYRDRQYCHQYYDWSWLRLCHFNFIWK